MESTYKKYNNLIGWLTFAIAAFTYCSTVEPTASFWDCGEFIASAFKLEVGHPPGAPLWMLIARTFGLMAGGDVTMVAYWINIFSALSTAFAILFLFWTITALAKKVALLNNAELTQGKMWGILFSGFIGAVAYTFTDTIWFSAVEGEVYASSMFFTAIVFWLILKWEAIADEKYADRYLILIAYLMGLSIGVHLLNLLTIPAIVFVYYFKKNKNITPFGFVKAGVVGVVILAFVQFFVIQSLVKIANFFELKFVNSFGMPFYSGIVFFALLIITVIIVATKYARKKKFYLMHTLVMSFVVILIGYLPFLVIVIRSNANPPMDENNPETSFSLLPYLNREQYGSQPLFYGQTFNSEYDPTDRFLDGDPTYYKDVKADPEKYLMSSDGKDKIPNYDKRTMKLFPRMYSTEGRHKQAYEKWLNFRKEKRGKRVVLDNDRVVYIPTHRDDIEFFARYQFNFMYWRYFMWNFAGRQNDLQASDLYEMRTGNWMSGIGMIDKERVGDDSILPSYMNQNKGRNYYFFLPLILGIIGLIFHFTKSVKDGFVVMLLFFMTGIGIIIYLNQPPYQPRERDYAYVGSFYTFAIWIGLGVQALIFFMSSFKKETLSKLTFVQKMEEIGAKEVVYTGAAGAGLGLFAMLMDNKGVGYSLLFIGAIVALVPILCHYLGQMIQNERSKAMFALVMTLVVPCLLAAENWDDHDRSGRYSASDIAKCYLESCAPNAILFTNGDNDTFPLWYVQEVEGFRTDVRVVNLSLLNTDWFINQMKRKAYDSEPVPFSLTEDKYREDKRNGIYVVNLYEPDPDQEKQEQLARTLQYMATFVDAQTLAYYKQIAKDGEDVDNLIKLIASENPITKWPNGDNFMEFISTRKAIVKVDSAAVLANGTVRKEDAALIPKQIVFDLGEEDYMQKNKMMLLDLLATNDWKRPVYFSSTVGPENFFGLEDYFRREGMTYRLTPLKLADTERNKQTGDYGYIDSDILYENIMKKFQWGNLNDTTIYIDEQNSNLCNYLGAPMQSLAEQLIREGKKDSALKVLDKIVAQFPDKNFPYDEKVMLGVADNYLTLGQKEKGMRIFNILKKYFYEDYNYMVIVNSKYKQAHFGHYTGDYLSRFTLYGKLYPMLLVARKHNLDPKLIKDLESKLPQH
ncbi:MAG: protein O-mannosyl-transferase family [Flavobacteriales bacterium]